MIVSNITLTLTSSLNIEVKKMHPAELVFHSSLVTGLFAYILFLGWNRRRIKQEEENELMNHQPVTLGQSAEDPARMFRVIGNIHEEELLMESAELVRDALQQVFPDQKVEICYTKTDVIGGDSYWVWVSVEAECREKAG